ncbi:FERM domain-containing protein 8-like protein [Dinothrombium tinctorium]|uniref:FERM domain-containing protein 8 n=1 Tax=Dinothrombium tinctorium TaxID=1965070 RepID=A0A3S4RLJ3_9ACAR|nr:FERM domain-containing protein 8-like protein [Dinothrombium tinctorium]
MTSPLLELQLKPLHRPFSILEKWNELLSKYGSIDPLENKQHVTNDEPILSFQKNLFLSRRDEIVIEDIEVLRLLYEEAKVNVIDGRYPTENYERLAAIQAMIEFGPFDKNIHTAEFFKKRLHSFLPLSHIKFSKWKSRIKSCANIEHQIIINYKNISNFDCSPKNLMRSYLSTCWSLPFYGSAYFHGVIEKLKGRCNLKTWIAVNQEGVHLIEKRHSVSTMIRIFLSDFKLYFIEAHFIARLFKFLLENWRFIACQEFTVVYFYSISFSQRE